MANTTHTNAPADVILYHIERIADMEGYPIEENEDYLFVCNILTAIDFQEEVSFEELERGRNALELLCKQFGLNFEAERKQAVAIAWGE